MNVIIIEMEESKHPAESLKGVDIDRMMRTIDAAEAQIKKAEGMPCIVIIGNTGTGKSTLMNSILHGPTSMNILRTKVDTEFGKVSKYSIVPLKTCVDE